MKGCATADATVPIYLLAGSFADAFADGLVECQPFLGRSCDLVVARVLLDLVVDGAGHPHAPVDVPDGALDVVDGLPDPVYCCVVELHF